MSKSLQMRYCCGFALLFYIGLSGEETVNCVLSKIELEIVDFVVNEYWNICIDFNVKRCYNKVDFFYILNNGGINMNGEYHIISGIANVVRPVSEPKNLSEDDKRRILALIKEKGGINGAQMPRELLSIGIDWNSYKASANSKIKEWICKNIPELCYVDNMCVLKSSVEPAKGIKAGDYVLLAELTAQQLDSDGNVDLTAVNDILLRNGYRGWKEFNTDGKTYSKMSEWAAKYLSRWFELSNNNLCLHAKDGVQIPSLNVFPPIDPYIDFDPNSEAMANEIFTVERAIWFGYWQYVANMMVALTGGSSKNAEKWKCIIIHRYCMAKRDGGEFYRIYPVESDADGASECRLVVKLRMDDQEGRPLYMVFRENYYEGKEAQKWALMEQGICYSGMPGVGMWLKECGIDADNSGILKLRSSLEDAVNDAEKLNSDALLACERVYSAIKSSSNPDKEDIKKISAYSESWSRVEDCLTDFGKDVSAYNTLDRIREDCFSEDATGRLIAEKCDLLIAVIEAAKNELVSDGVIAEDDVSTRFDEDMAAVCAFKEEMSAGIRPKASAIRVLIEVYSLMCRLAEKLDNSMSDQDIDDLDRISSHLNILPKRVKLICGCGAFVDNSSALALLDSELVIYGRTSRQIEAVERNTKRVTVDKGSVTGILRSVISKRALRDNIIDAYGSPNELEILLIRAEFDAAAELAGSATDMADMGYSAEEADRIAERIEEYRSKLSLSALDADSAERLYRIVGNHNNQAEKYWLMDIDSDRSFASLAELYRNECRIADYTYLLENNSGKKLLSKDLLYLLNCYYEIGKNEELLKLLKSHPELLYRNDAGSDGISCVAMAIEASRALGLSDDIEYYTDIRRNIRLQHEAPNAIEQALINYDIDMLNRFTMPDGMASTGYSAQRADNIAGRITDMLNGSTELPDKVSSFYSGLRVWSILGSDSAALAEHLMWDGFNEDNIVYQMRVGILPLLFSQGRYEEIISIYDAYRDMLCKDVFCRSRYFISLCHCGCSYEAVEYARSYLVDIISYYDDMEDVISKLDADMFSVVDMLKSAADSNDYVNSVILANERMRDYVIYSGNMLEDIGYSKNHINSIVNAYKTGYPTGSDPAAVGKRLRLFVKDCSELTEKLARFGLPASDNAVLLCEILAEDGSRSEELAKLFDEYPELQKVVPEIYLGFVLKTGRYDALLAMRINGEFTADTSVNESIISLAEMICHDVSVKGASFDISHIAGYPNHFADLAHCLYERSTALFDGADEFSVLVGEVFERAAARWNTQYLDEFITAKGALTQDELIRYQQVWSEDKQTCAAAIYIYKVMGIGDISELSESYYAEISHDSAGDIDKCNMLLKLYPDKGSELNRSLVIVGMEAILRESITAAQKGAGIAALLREHSYDEETAVLLFDRLEENDLLTNSDVLRVIVTAESLYRCMAAERIIRSERALSGSDKPLMTLLAAAVYDGMLPADIQDRLYELCRYVYSIEAMYCMFGISRAQGRVYDAQALYISMLNNDADMVLPPFVLDDMTEYSAASARSYKQLLNDILQNTSPEDIVDVFMTHHAAVAGGVPVSDEDRTIAENVVADYDSKRTGSTDVVTDISAEDTDKNIEAAMRVIYGDSSNKRGWKAAGVLMYDETAPEFSVKLMSVLAYGSNQQSTWKKLYDELLGNEQYSYLIPSAVEKQFSLVNSVDTAFAAQKHLIGVVDRMAELDIPEEQLDRITDSICATVGMTSELHKELCAVSEFAAKLGCAERVMHQPNVWNGFFTSGNGIEAAGAFVARLLLSGDYTSAIHMLNKLCRFNNARWSKLFLQLENKDEAALAEYCSDAVNIRLLNIMLPECHRPSYDGVIYSDIIRPVIESDEPSVHKEAAELIIRLKDIFDDIGLDKAMFFVCKRAVDFENKLVYLYNAVCRLCSLNEDAPRFTVNAPLRKRKDMYCNMMLLRCLADKLGILHLLPESPGIDVSAMERCQNALTTFTDEEATEVVFAKVTGDWTAVISRLYQAWCDNMDSTYMVYLLRYGGYLEDEVIGCRPVGLVRSLLQLYSSFDTSERAMFCEWFAYCGHVFSDSAREGNPVFSDTRKKNSLRKTAAAFFDARFIINTIYSDVDISSDSDYLKLPLEEYSLHQHLLEQACLGDYDGDYRRVLVMMAASRDMYSLLLSAKELYTRYNKFDVSCAIMRAARVAVSLRERHGLGIDIVKDDELKRMYGIGAKVNADMVQRTFDALWSARIDVCNCLSGSGHAGEFCKKTAAHFANLVCDMVNCRRAKFLPIVLSYADEKRRRFMLDMYHIIVDKNRVMRQRLVDAMTRPQERHAAMRVWSWMARDKELKDKAQEMLNAGGFKTDEFVICQMNDDNELHIVPIDKIKEELERLLEHQQREFVSEAENSTEFNALETQSTGINVPKFVDSLCAELAMDASDDSGQQILFKKLLIEYSELCEQLMLPMLDNDAKIILLERRRTTAAKLYLLSVYDEHTLIISALRLCISHIYLLRESRDPELRRQQISDVLISTAKMVSVFSEDEISSDSELGKMYEEYSNLAMISLIDILQNITSVLELATLVISNHEQLVHFSELAKNSRNYSEGSVPVFAMMSAINDIYRSGGSDDVKAKGMSDLLDRYRPVYSGGNYWYRAQHNICALLMSEKGRLLDKPVLNIELFNGKVITTKGVLYGQVVNVGSRDAEGITLLVSSDVGPCDSGQRVNRMHAGGMAPFEVSCKLPSETTKVTVTFAIEYEYEGNHYTTDAVVHELDVVPCRNYEPIIKKYPETTIEDYTPDENGVIRSKTLIGREFEKAQLISMAGESSSEIKNVLIRGIRRAGKSSLINFYIAYIKHKFEDEVFPVYVTLQGGSHNNIVYFMFVEAVLTAVMAKCDNRSLFDSAEWKSFYESSTSDRMKNMDFSEVQVFMSSLSRMLGQKLVIMYDEFQTVVEFFGDKAGDFDSFMRGLDSLLSNSSMNSYVNFVLCGSNELLRLQMDGGTLHQAFQRLAKIEVGSLPYDDMCAYLTKPMDNIIRYTEEAKRYIYRYTGGAVWYTGLIATRIIDILNKENRRVVYPSDVINAIPSVIDDKSCSQFTESCRTEEKAILYAMQEFTGHQDQYVTLEQLCSVLPEKLGNETGLSHAVLMEKIGLLMRLKLIEHSRTSSGDCYRFTTGMFRYYFRYKNNDQRVTKEDEIFVPKDIKGSNARMTDDDLLAMLN